MTRPAPLLSGLATLLVAALLSIAAAPMAAEIPAATSCCGDHCPSPEVPGGAATCCTLAPPASHDAATVPAPPAAPDALLALVNVHSAASLATPYAAPLPRDTGPPPGPRRHLTLSVFLI